MKAKDCILLLLALSVGHTVNASELNEVNTTRDGTKFISTLMFSESVESDSISIEYLNHTIQVNIPGATMAAEKNVQKPQDERVKSVYTYQPSPKVLRSRIIYKEKFKASDFKNYVKVDVDGPTVKITVDEGNRIGNHRIQPKDIEMTTNQDLDKEVAQIMAIKDEGEASIVKAKDNGTVTKRADQKQPLGLGRESNDESQIPVLKSAKKDNGETTPLFFRMAMSFAVVGLTGIGMILFARWWSKNHKTNKIDTKIEVLTQHYLGPKKSLAIIRVAGESLLVGVTDNNISMLKTLSFIDDEIPDQVPQHFDTQLDPPSHFSDEDFEIQDRIQPSVPEPTEDFSVGSIKDLVNSKLKKMRSL